MNKSKIKSDDLEIEFENAKFGALPEESSKKVYSVTQINRQARLLLETQFATVWVEGEISNFKHHTSGHMYFSLKDETSQISACFFSRNNQTIKFIPKDGLKVLAFGKVSLYESRGQYQLYVERLEPKGVGALQLAFLQLKEKLEKEGLFRPERKRPIPKYPQTVGIVTSPTGAAIQDIMNVVQRRFNGTEILIYPVRVQGDGAAQEIASAIRDFNTMPGIDVMIVGRGGGSIEDLWAFNEEVVARAVYESKIPVISAVGHEIDWTICDFVADYRAPTPSAAAEIVTANRVDLEERLRDYESRMRNVMKNFLESQREFLKNILSSYAFKQPLLLIDQFSQRLDELIRQMQNYLKSAVTQKSQSFQTVCGRLHALSPLAILERGYSLTFNEKGQLLKDARSVQVGDALRTKFFKGEVHSKVTKIERSGEKKNVE